jgi:hypothetical protein
MFIVSTYIKGAVGLRRPVVRSGGAVSRRVATPRPIPFLAAE